MPERTVAVIGGGITGLATAWYLQEGGSAVTLLESGPRSGGKIRTQELVGVPVEAGPDTFLARAPWAVDLCRELGLGDDLVAPATGDAFIWTAGRLVPLPERHVLGVPTALRPLVRSGVLSRAGVARAALDLALPRGGFGADPSVAEVVGRRMGREVVERLVDPLVGGINAGRADRLSVAATARPLADGAARHRSLLLGLRRAPRPAAGPVFLGLTGGLQRLVDALDARLDDVRLGSPVSSVSRTPAGGYRLDLPAGQSVVADTVVVTVPAPAAARLLAAVSPAAAAGLATIRHASVVTATLAYPPSALARPLPGAGMLVPRVDRRLLTACTWSTSKWPALARSGMVMLRGSAGRDGDERAMDMGDDELVQRMGDELSEAIGVSGRPATSLVTRWRDGFPQYDVGHQARVAAIESALAADAPGIFVAGAAYRGLGITACVEQARGAADLATAQSRLPGGSRGDQGPRSHSSR